MAEWHAETHQGTATVNKDGTVTLTRTFKYDTGNASARPAWGVAGIGIYKYDVHPDDSTCLATDVTCSPVSGELGWFDLTYTYSNRVFDQGVASTTGGEGGTGPGSLDPTVNANPTTRPPTVSWSTTSRMIPFTRDWDDPRKAVQNSAGQPFEGLEVESINAVITINFNRAGAVDIATKQMAYQNTVNDDLFSIVPIHGPYAAGELRCNAWTGSLQYEQGYGWYTSCSVEFEWAKDGWELDVIDQGMYERVGHGGGVYAQERFIDPTTGQNTDAPVKLNGSGRKLNPGDNPGVGAGYFVVDGGTNDVTVFRKFYRYEWKDWVNIFA